MKLVDDIGINMRSASRNGYIDGLVATSTADICARYWNKLNNFQKHAFTSSAKHTSEDDPKNDPHIFEDDPEFQEAVKKGVTAFTEQAIEQMTPLYLESTEKLKELKDYINKNKGGYTYQGLVTALSLYQNNPSLEMSRSRRYNGGKPKEVPLSIKARHDAFMRYNMIAEGWKKLSSLSDHEQDEIIRANLPKGTLSGYPSFTSQNGDNFLDLTDQLCEIINFPKIKEDKEQNRFITVKYVEDLVKHCASIKFYAPFQALYRTHWDKVRAVFGGNWILKLIGCVFVSAKHMGYTKDIAANLGLPVNEDKYDSPLESKPTKIYSKNNIPYISQLPWDTQFELYRDKLPPLVNEEISLVSEQFLQDKFGVNLPRGEYQLNVIGDDYSKFDTTVIIEDLEWLQGHLFFGWLFKYVMDCLVNSEVWLVAKKIFDIIFKSGHPFTADWGTDIHHNRNYVAVALANEDAGGKVYEIKRNEIKSFVDHKDVCDILRIDGKYYVYEYAKDEVIMIGRG